MLLETLYSAITTPLSSECALGIGVVAVLFFVLRLVVSIFPSPILELPYAARLIWNLITDAEILRNFILGVGLVTPLLDMCGIVAEPYVVGLVCVFAIQLVSLVFVLIFKKSEFMRKFVGVLVIDVTPFLSGFIVVFNLLYNAYHIPLLEVVTMGNDILCAVIAIVWCAIIRIVNRRTILRGAGVI